MRGHGVATQVALQLTGGLLWHAGYRVYVVHTGSMTPAYRPGDLVVDAPAPGHVRPGEVITFRHSDVATDVVTHRVVAVTEDGIHTRGDANRSPDSWTIPSRLVRGRVISRIPYAGYVAVFLQRPSGIASIASSALALTLLWGLFFPAVDDALPASGDGRDSSRPTGRRRLHKATKATSPSI